MRIEKILSPKPGGNRWTLYLEDGQTLRVGEGEMVDFALHSGMELEEEQLTQLTHVSVMSALRDRAVSILSSKQCSKWELKRRLANKGAAQQQAEEVVQWAERIGLLSEEEYAKTIARHYSAKGYGIYKVKDELYRRRLPKDLWDDALHEMEPPEESIDRYLQSHLKSRDPKDVKKAASALARRGFPWSEISDGMERLRIIED